MADPAFFPRQGPKSLGDIAALVGGVLSDPDAADQQILDCAGIGQAEPGCVTFMQQARYAPQLQESAATACLIHPDHKDRAPDHMVLILVDNPHKAYAQAVQCFYPPQPLNSGIADGAHVDDSAVIGDGCEIAAGAVIQAGAEVGAGTFIGANSVIGKNVKIGRGCRIAPLVSISHALVGDRVTLHPGAKIGQDGFGFAIGMDGHEVLPQLGRVIIQDRCNIGANVCIDRGAMEDTVVGEATFIDNLVQIGHNSQIGRFCVICGAAGLAGSVTLQDYVVIGGAANIADHVTIGMGAQIGGRGGVTRDVAPGEKMAGFPAVPLRQHLRQTAAIAKLVKK